MDIRHKSLSNSYVLIIILFLIIIFPLISSLKISIIVFDSSSFIKEADENTCITQRCWAWPGPYNGTQPNNFSFQYYINGDEHGSYSLYHTKSTVHPIKRFDGWWYFCYWNESKFVEYDVRDQNQSTPSPIPWIIRHYLLISTGIKIGDELSDQIFNFTQKDGRVFKAKFIGTRENPLWVTLSGRPIYQAIDYINGIEKPTWFYAECTSNKEFVYTDEPVNEYKKLDDTIQSIISILVLIPSLFALTIAFYGIFSKKSIKSSNNEK